MGNSSRREEQLEEPQGRWSGVLWPLCPLP